MLKTDSEVHVPQFKSTIPAELLKSLNPEEVYLFEGISRLEQKTDWIISEVVEARRDRKETGEAIDNLTRRVQAIEVFNQTLSGSADRLKTIEDWKNVFMGKWGVLSAVGLLTLSGIVGALVKSGVDRIFSSSPPDRSSSKP